MSKNKLSRFSLIVILVLCISNIQVDAGSISATYNGTFADDWLAFDGSNANGKVVYGFNTFLINEDICYGYHDNSRHYAKIYNGSGVWTSSSKAAGKKAAIEVRHSGSQISYYCEW